MSALLNSTTDFADSTDDKTEPLCWKAISVIRVIGGSACSVVKSANKSSF